MNGSFWLGFLAAYTVALIAIGVPVLLLTAAGAIQDRAIDRGDEKRAAVREAMNRPLPKP